MYDSFMLGGSSPGKEKPEKSVKEAAYEKALKGYPVISFDKLEENWYKFPVYAALQKVARKLSEKLKGDNRLLSGGIGRGLIEAFGQVYKQKFDTTFFETFPRLQVWKTYAEGITDIDTIYVTKVDGVDLPVYVKKKGGTDPQAEDLANNADDAVHYKVSPYNGVDMSSFVRSRGLIEPALTIFSRGDFAFLIDQEDFLKWYARDEAYLIHQKGEEVKLAPSLATVTKGGKSYAIRAYRRPKDPKTISDALHSSMLWYWGVGSLIYNVFDKPFDPIQNWALRNIKEKGLPEKILKTLFGEEYKAIAATRRRIFRNSARPEFDFDLTDLDNPDEYVKLQKQRKVSSN